MEIAQSLEKKYSDRPAGCRGRVSVRVWGLRPKQGHSQKFATEGDKRRGLGPEVPHGCSGAEPRWGPGGLSPQKPETNANCSIWNDLPEYLRDPEFSIDNFRRQLKTFLFAQY